MAANGWKINLRIAGGQVILRVWNIEKENDAIREATKMAEKFGPVVSVLEATRVENVGWEHRF